MDHRKDTVKRLRALPAFTLIELMLVLAILALLVAISGDVFTSGMGSQRLAVAAKLLSSDLDHAVLMAQKENRPVEVRFLRFKSDDMPATSEDPSVDTNYRGYQFVVLTGFDADGVPEYRMLSGLTRFPQGIALMTNPEFTTLATLPARQPGKQDLTFGPAYTFVAFQIRPDGTTSLPRLPRPVLTLVEDKDLGGPLPPSYRSITIDPDNGHTRVY